jgi:hypothetical protein
MLETPVTWIGTFHPFETKHCFELCIAQCKFQLILTQFRMSFGEAMLAMGVQLSDEHMTVLFNEFDTTGDELMDFEEFLHLVDECLAGSDVESQSSRSSSSESFSQLSSDSQALRKHPLILQVSMCMHIVAPRSVAVLLAFV